MIFRISRLMTDSSIDSRRRSEGFLKGPFVLPAYCRSLSKRHASSTPKASSAAALPFELSHGAHAIGPVAGTHAPASRRTMPSSGPPVVDRFDRLTLARGDGDGSGTRARMSGHPAGGERSSSSSCSCSGNTSTGGVGGEGGRPEASSSVRVRYTAFLLDDGSRDALLAFMRELGAAPPLEWSVTCDHVTIQHTPSEAQLASFPFGVPCEMAVLGVAGDERARAVHVDVPDFVPQPASAVPHVTVAVAPGVRPVVSGEMLANAMVSGDYMATADAMPLTLTGRLGGVTMTDERVYQAPPPRVPVCGLSSCPKQKQRSESGASVGGVSVADTRAVGSLRSGLMATSPPAVVEGKWGARRGEEKDADVENEAGAAFVVETVRDAREGDGERLHGLSGSRGAHRQWWRAVSGPGEWPPEYPASFPYSGSSPPRSKDDDVIAEWAAAGARDAAKPRVSWSDGFPASTGEASPAIAATTIDTVRGNSGGGCSGGASSAARDEAKALLSAIFPAVSEEAMAVTLEAFGGDVDAAAEHIALGNAGVGVGEAAAASPGVRQDLVERATSRRATQLESNVVSRVNRAGERGVGGCGGDASSCLFTASSGSSSMRPLRRAAVPTPVDPPASRSWGGGLPDAIAGGNAPSFAATEKIAQLCEVFPDVDPAVVATALAESSGDRHAACAILASDAAGVAGGGGGRGWSETRGNAHGGGEGSVPSNATGFFARAQDGWEMAEARAGNSDTSSSHLGTTAPTIADEWERVATRRTHHRARSSSSFAEKNLGPDTSTLDRALHTVRRWQAPHLAHQSRQSEAMLRREVHQLHEGAAALSSSRKSLAALSRAAFQRGDGKLARELSQRAAVLEAKISAAKETATQSAMRFHNNRNKGGAGAAAVIDVDLHGQTADSAMDCLGDVLVGAVHTSAAGLRIVTGVGRHSAGGISRLLPAVRRFFDTGGVHYLEEGPGVVYVPFGTRR